MATEVQRRKKRRKEYSFTEDVEPKESLHLKKEFSDPLVMLPSNAPSSSNQVIHYQTKRGKTKSASNGKSLTLSPKPFFFLRLKGKLPLLYYYY